MRTLTALCWSLAIVASAWVGMRAVDKGVTIKLVHLHILASPQEVKR